MFQRSSFVAVASACFSRRGVISVSRGYRKLVQFFVNVLFIRIPRIISKRQKLQSSRREIKGITGASMETRYAPLAALFFSIKGHNWLDDHRFLSPEHECKWASSTLGTGGIRCNPSFQVLELRLDELVCFSYFCIVVQINGLTVKNTTYPSQQYF